MNRPHARIVDHQGELWVEDLTSANRTFLNGDRIRATVLRDGDNVQVGSTAILKFTYADELEESFRQKMQDAALRDGLTRAYNKGHFLQRLQVEVPYADGSGKSAALHSGKSAVSRKGGSA